MSDDIERLRRLHAQDPNDARIGARLKAALLQAGRLDEVARRCLLGFRCSQDWATMAPRGPGLRRCADCGRDVRFGITYEDLERQAAKGECIAVRPGCLVRVIEGLARSTVHGLTRGLDGPCIVDAKDRFPSPPPAPTTSDEPFMAAPGYGAPPPRWLHQDPPHASDRDLAANQDPFAEGAGPSGPDPFAGP